MLIKISEIILDEHAQPRSELNSETIQDYADAMMNGAKFPPVIVFGKNGKKWLADGWHRVHGAKVAKLDKILADIRDGTLRDAILYAMGANADNGMRRSNQDKRRAVTTLLADADWRKRSDRWIAETCKVNNHLVSELRQKQVGVLPPVIVNSSHLGLDGKTYRLPEKPQQTNITPDDFGLALIDDPDTETPSQIYVDEDGNDYEPTEVRQIIDEQKPELVSHFNKTNDNIKWAKWSWNPVTGCKHDCPYCYARDIANRFYPEKFEPTFHPERLNAPNNTNPLIDVPGGKNVFVCSMADLFGAWVPNDWIFQVMRQVESNPQWNFLFLTKNPRRLSSITFPNNAWVGATVDSQARVKPTEDALKDTNAKIKFVSCEPVLEPIVFNEISILDWLIIGGQSKSSQLPEFQPNWDWVISLSKQALDAGIKVYWKPNLLVCPEEYPG